MADVRYPLGPFERPATFDARLRQTAIRSFASAPKELKAALSGLSDGQFDTPYRPGGWTVRQVVHHLADSHLNGYVRFKLALTEDHPTIKTYDQQLWAETVEAKTAPVETSLALLVGLHARWTALLESLSETDFRRTWNHPESGSLDLDLLLALYAWHGRHHTAQIAGLRDREGW